MKEDRRTARANLITSKVIAANDRVVKLKKKLESAIADLKIAVDDQDKWTRANWSEQ